MMGMFKFSPNVKSILKLSGWYQEREVDIREVIDDLKCAGFSINQCAADILRAFHGLSILPENGQVFSCINMGWCGAAFSYSELLSSKIEYFEGMYPIGTTELAVLYCNSESLCISISYSDTIWIKYGTFEEMLDIFFDYNKSRHSEKFRFHLSHL